MNPDAIKLMISIAREGGCKSLRVDGFEIVFFEPERAEVPYLEGTFHDRSRSPLSEDEVKFFHVGGSGMLDASGEEIKPPFLGDGDAD